LETKISHIRSNTNLREPSNVSQPRLEGINFVRRNGHYKSIRRGVINQRTAIPSNAFARLTVRAKLTISPKRAAAYWHPACDDKALQLRTKFVRRSLFPIARSYNICPT
jgi:hypothetical protein